MNHSITVWRVTWEHAGVKHETNWCNDWELMKNLYAKYSESFPGKNFRLEVGKMNKVENIKTLESKRR